MNKSSQADSSLRKRNTPYLHFAPNKFLKTQNSETPKKEKDLKFYEQSSASRASADTSAMSPNGQHCYQKYETLFQR